MQTMKSKVGQNLTETWLGKSLIRVGQKVDDVWMAIGQLLVKSWSVFKAKEVGRKLDKSWTDFEGKKVQQGYNYGTTFLKDRVCQGYANDMPEFRSHELLQPYSSITPKITSRLLQFFSNTSPEIKGFSLKKVSQQLPSDYPENKDPSLETSGQNQDEIGIKTLRYRFGKIAVTLRWFVGEMWVAGFGKVSVRVRQFGGYRVGQFLGKTRVNLTPFYPGIKQVIQPLPFITHSLIVHNKRVSYGYTKVTPALHQECDQLLPNATGNRPFLSLFDIARLFLYVVLPDQNL